VTRLTSSSLLRTSDGNYSTEERISGLPTRRSDVDCGFSLRVKWDAGRTLDGPILRPLKSSTAADTISPYSILLGALSPPIGYTDSRLRSSRVDAAVDRSDQYLKFHQLLEHDWARRVVAGVVPSNCDT
jgi:hypothetical protein